MNIVDVIIGHRVLVQSSAEVKEHAQIMGINLYNGLVIVKLSNNTLREIDREYILKDFEA